MKINDIKNKKIFLLLILLILLMFLIIIGFFVLRKDNKDFLFKDKEVYDLYVNYDEIQKKTDEVLLGYVNDKNITMYSPKIILNPYDSSPLTALVIFYTEDSTSIKLYINDKFMTTVESSNSHIIPIYGLREDYNNLIKLIDDNNNESIINIKTDKLKDSDFYTYKSTYSTNEHLFINSPMGKYTIDNEGYITWYRDVNYNEMDLNLDKKIYFIDKFLRIIETDFMGRVYKIYHTDAFYSNHKIKKLNNNNIMVINDSFMLSEINYETAEILYSINLLEILKNIDENFNIPIENNYINYFQYNEEDKTLLISIRGIDAIINYDLLNKKIIWLFSNSELFSNKFDRYKLNLINGNYFKGQHTPYLDGNLLYVFDNNNFAFPNSGFSVSEKSSAVIYEIEGTKVKEIYRYKSDFGSGWYGSFYEKNGIKNINLGCIVNDETGNYSKVIELDEKDNIITEFTTNYDELTVYESFRDTFYNEITSNYQINLEILSLYSDEDNILKYLSEMNKDTEDIKEELQNAIIDEALIEYSNLGISIDTIGNVEMLFVDENYDYYKLEIEYSEVMKGVCHYIWQYLINLKGKYAVYIKINDKYYNPNLVFNIR